MHLQAYEFSGDDVLVQKSGGVIDVKEQFSELSKYFLIASKFMTFSPELL